MPSILLPFFLILFLFSEALLLVRSATDFGYSGDLGRFVSKILLIPRQMPLIEFCTSDGDCRLDSDMDHLRN